MIKRVLCLAICVFALAVLALVADVWKTLDGQAVYKLTAADDAAIADKASEIAAECEVSLAAFAMRDTWDGIRLYECAAYHPEAFGIVLCKGVPITDGHIDSCSNVVMLNTEAAMTISPSLDCIGQTITIEGMEYTVIGVYEDSVQANAFTYTASASAILPAQRGGDIRTWYVWTKADEENVFAYQQVGNVLSILHSSMDVGSYQALDISGNVSAGVQRCRWIMLAVLVILCIGFVRHTRRRQRGFKEKLRNNFEEHYPFAAVLKSILPFARDILPVIVACMAVAAFAVYCAANIYIGVDSVPAKLLDLGEWLDIWQRRIVEANTVGQMPVYAVNLSSWLSRFAWFSGITAIIGAAFGTAEGRKGGCDG